MSLKQDDYDLVIDAPNPTDWVSWQKGVLTPKLPWDLKCDSLWQSFSLHDDAIYIGMQPIAETQYGLWRNWPLERWVELIDLLGQIPKVKILLFGFDATPHFSGSHVIDLRGKTNLFELLSIVKNKCKALVLPDSGILSMVYYLDTCFPINVVSLWGDNNHGILKQNVNSPNSFLKHVPLFGERRNLSSLSAKKVLNALFPLKPVSSIQKAETISPQLPKNVGAIFLAGGEGSRLGIGPKGFFPILGKPLFQILCEKVPRNIPIAIMTSPLNHAETVSFFGKHAFFGKEIYFFKQPMLPLLNKKKKETTLLSPDGNGSLFSSFANSPIYSLFEKRGIQYISVIPIENPLADPIDPYLFAHLQNTNADVVLKCIAEKEANPKMGALVQRENGGMEIVEYTETDPHTSYFFRYTGMLGLKFSFFKRASQCQLPFHFVWKQRGKTFFWKREKLLFDVLPYAKKVEALCYDKKKIYSPLKEFQNLSQIEADLLSL